MRSIPLDQIPFAGALDVEISATSAAPRRLPAWTKPQLVDLMVAAMVTMPSGVRIDVMTDSDVVELDLMCTVLKFVNRPERPPVVDVVVDGKLVQTTAIPSYAAIEVSFDRTSFAYVPGEASTLRCEVPGSGVRHVEIWMPHACTAEVQGMRVNDDSACDSAIDSRKRWVHYGSSISHCMEADSPKGTWPAVAAELADVSLINLGLAGQCHLDQFVARTIRDLDADFISVKAGINIINLDSMRERTYVAALNGFIDTVRDGHPDTPFIVSTPIFCPIAEDRVGPTIPTSDFKFRTVERPAELAMGALHLQRVRQIMSELVATRRSMGDDNLHLVDGLNLFGAEDAGDLPDDLHPNPCGYRRMGERFHQMAFVEGPFASHS